MEEIKAHAEVENYQNVMGIPAVKRQVKDQSVDKSLTAINQGTRRFLKARHRGIRSISLSTSSSNYAVLRCHVNHYITYEFNVLYALKRLYLIYFYMLVLIMALLPLAVLGFWLHLSFSPGQWFKLYGYYFGGLSLLLLLIFPIRLLTGRNLEELFFPWLQISNQTQRTDLRERDFGTSSAWLNQKNLLAIAWILMIAFLSSYLFWYLLHQEQLFSSNLGYVILPILSFWSFWLMGGLLFLFAGSSILYFLRRQLNANHPQSVVCIRMIEALDLLLRYPKDWSEGVFKRALVQKFEDAARRVEFDLPRLLQAGDAITEAWLLQSSAGIARSLREQKKSILLSETGARQSLIDFISKEILCVIAGDWGSMNRMDVVSAAANFRQGLINRLGRLLGAILKGGLPLLVLWLLQRPPFAIHNNLIDYAFILSMIYLLFSILSEIDPLYQDKIKAIKELLSLILQN